MKQGASFALFAALLLAVARHPGADSTTPKLSHPAIAGMPRLHATSKPASARYQGCTAFEFNKQPKSALLDPHYGEANKLFHRFLGYNSDDGSPKADSRSASGLTYVIALMPDPRHTHLALWFDRNIEVIQQAAQDERYTYDSSWLPWPSSGPQPYLLRDQELQEEASEERRESCPGLLLFRHSVAPGPPENYKNGLAVLLVAEQPTGGINTKQWQNATQWLGSHQDPKTPLRILGPTFSGSVPSLERLLEDHRSPQAIIAGGGLGSANATDWFIQQTHIPLHLFEENDPVQFEYLKRYEAYRNYGSDQQDCNGLAILSEDETAYGSAPIELNSSGAQRKTTLSEDETPYGSAPIDPNSPRALRKTTQTPCLKLFYPRDISALRSAYEEQSILSPSNNSSARAARVVLHANLKEESVKGGDTVPDFDQQREALSQEAKLYGIVSELNVHHTKLILLRCTNPLDYLFLASFLHYRYPEGRLISSTSDLLFRRALDTSEYRGMLALSNYPLYPEEAHLLGDQKPADDVHRVFASDNQEAAYNAARCVIKGEGCLKGGDGFPVDYHDPLWIKMQSNHAPVWLSVLGRDGYWPVARLPIGPPTALRACGSALTKPAGEPSKSAGELCTSITDIHHADTFPEASPESPLSWKIALFATIVVLGINVWEIQRRNLYDFRMTSDMSTSKWGGHLFFGLAPTVFALLLSSVALTPLVLLFFTHLSFSNRLWFDMVVVASLAILILQTGRGLHQAYGSHGVLACLGSVTAGSILLGLYLWVPERELLIYRSLHLLNGVSPLLPLLFFLFGFYLFARQVLICSSLLAEG